MYPLDMKNGVGFAVANDEAEHKTLSDAGYLPSYEGQLDKAGQGEEQPKKRGRPRKVQE